MKKIIFLLLFFITIKSSATNNICIFIQGQSNAWGQGTRASLSSTYVGTISKAQIWNGSNFVRLNYTTDTSNQHPSHIPGLWLRNYVYGIELGLAYDLVNNMGWDTVFIIKYAVGSTWTYDTVAGYGSWNVNRANDIYQWSKTDTKAGIAALAGHNIKKYLYIW